MILDVLRLTKLFADILKHYKRNIWMKNAKGTA